MIQQQSSPTYVLSAERQRILRFLLVGVSSTVLDFVLLTVLKSAGLSTLLANTIAFSVGTIYNFAISRAWTYAGIQHKPAGIQFVQYALASLVQLVLNDAVVLTLEPVFRALLSDASWSYLPAKIVATGAVAVLSYISNRLWIFNEPAEGAQ